MQSIKLENGQWSFDEKDQLGPAGGFGEVFRGKGNREEVAIKRLKISARAASHREMKIGSALYQRDHEHVVPVLDFGQDAEGDRYYLVMPICEHSLQDRLDSTGPLPFEDVKKAVRDIITGLLEVEDLVHRDLKPGNVLWHEGKWKIADFGIAKFVEDVTSLESLRTSLTPAYAAPEQWKGDRPTTATDVYALGCIMFAMLTGSPPFVGEADDVREAHLHTAPLPLAGVDNRIAGLVATMLRKSAESRPSLNRCSKIFSEMQSAPVSAARAKLAAAGQVVSQEEAVAEAARKALERAVTERRELASEARLELRAIIERLFDAIDNEAENTSRTSNTIVLGPAHLTFDEATEITPRMDDLNRESNSTSWDIAANAYFSLRADRGASTEYDPGYYNFSVSLVFAKIPGQIEFRWHEISFHEIFSQRANFDQPFGLNPLDKDFQVAISNTMGKHQIAYGPLQIDGEDEVSFQERWLNLFAKAASKQLASPNQLPLPPNFFD